MHGTVKIYELWQIWNILRLVRQKQTNKPQISFWNPHKSRHIKSLQQTRHFFFGFFWRSPGVVMWLFLRFSRSCARCIFLWKWFLNLSSKKAIIFKPSISLVWYILRQQFTSVTMKSGGYGISMHFHEMWFHLGKKFDFSLHCMMPEWNVIPERTAISFWNKLGMTCAGKKNSSRCHVNSVKAEK